MLAKQKKTPCREARIPPTSCSHDFAGSIFTPTRMVLKKKVSAGLFILIKTVMVKVVFGEFLLPSH